MTTTALPPSRSIGKADVLLVGKVARAMAAKLWHRPNASDLESLGLVVLCDAAREHDPTRTSFAPYLVERLRWAMLSDARKSARRARLLDHVVPSSGSRVAAGASLDRDSTPLDEAEGDSPKPESRLEESRRRVHLMNALAQLPDEARHVIVAHYFGDESIEAIAGTIGRSKATVSRLHHAGLAELARQLAVTLDDSAGVDGLNAARAPKRARG